MDTLTAWRYIFDRWNCNRWQSLPDDVKTALGLHCKIGVCHGSLVTRTGASGMDEFIQRVNSRKEK